jgi:hypothetical protein
MSPEKRRQEEALDAILAATFAKGGPEGVDLKTLLAAFTPEELAKMDRLTHYLQMRRLLKAKLRGHPATDGSHLDV